MSKRYHNLTPNEKQIETLWRSMASEQENIWIPAKSLSAYQKTKNTKQPANVGRIALERTLASSWHRQ